LSGLPPWIGAEKSNNPAIRPQVRMSEWLGAGCREGGHRRRDERLKQTVDICGGTGVVMLTEEVV
jgi:hypothetical protein